MTLRLSPRQGRKRKLSLPHSPSLPARLPATSSPQHHHQLRHQNQRLRGTRLNKTVPSSARLGRARLRSLGLDRLPLRRLGPWSPG